MTRRILVFLIFLIAWIQVNAASTTVTISSSTSSPAIGTSVVLTANVTPATANGTIQFKDGGTNIGTAVTLSAGAATFTVTAITSGTHSYTAVYSGNAPNTFYTGNGTTPTTSSTPYSSPITVATTEQVQTISTSSGAANSQIGSASYVIGALPALQPTMSPYSGTYASPPAVTLTSASTSSHVIWYTTDGSTPNTGSAVYSGPVTISSTSTIKAFAAIVDVSDLNSQQDTKRVSGGVGWKLCTETAISGTNTCGGVGNVTPKAMTATGGSSPSLNTPADSLYYSQTTTVDGTISGLGGFTDTLLIHNSGQPNTNSEYATSDFWVYLVNNGQKDQHEYDMFIFDNPRNWNSMFGMQCNQSNNHWQHADQPSSWTDFAPTGAGSSINCATGLYGLFYNQWNHVQVGNHRIIGDTACNDTFDGISAFPCEYFDYLKINGNYIALNTIQTASLLNPASRPKAQWWGSETGYQFQLDSPAKGATTSNPVTTAEYIDNANYRITEAPSSITTATMTVLASLANTTPTATFSPLAGFYAAAQTVTLTNAGSLTGSTSNTLSVTTSTTLTPTTLALTAAGTTVTAKSTDVLTFTVAPLAATGTVAIKDGATTIATVTLSSGTATYTVPALVTGTHTFTATYSGDATHATSDSNTVNVTVTPITTTTTVTPSSGSIAAGSNVTLTAGLTPSGATGTFTFMEGGTSLGSSNITSPAFVVSAPSVGSHTYTVVYSGDAFYATSASSPTTVSVVAGKVATSINLAVSDNTVVAGASVGLTASITGATSGSIVFHDGSTTIATISISGGQALFNATALTAGTHVYSASFAGDSTHLASTSSNVNVVASTTTANKCYDLENMNSTDGNFKCQ